MTIRRFSDTPTAANRAHQIWLILIGCAANRQTLTYGLLAEKLGYQGAGVFAQLLDRILHYCHANQLPPLTSLVVNATSGLPGAGFSAGDPNVDRELVFGFNWYSLVPPPPEELEAAYKP